jgi:hypothetical protein
MLCQIEIEFLKNPSNFDSNHAKSLRHFLRAPTVFMLNG